MKTVASVVLLIAVFCQSYGEDGYLPPYIKPCHVDNGFEKCVREQIETSLPYFTKGVPELGVPSIDPTKLDDIKIDGNGLKLLFTDAAFHGLSHTRVTEFKVDLNEETFKLVFKGNFTLTAKYLIDGQILILPIRGNGNAVVDAHDTGVTISAKLGHVKTNVGDHFKLITPNYNYNLESTVFHFENLFNGNKELSDATHQFVNENWEQIMEELAPPVIKQIVRTVVRAINKFFAKVTINQIVIGYKGRQ